MSDFFCRQENDGLCEGNVHGARSVFMMVVISFLAVRLT